MKQILILFSLSLPVFFCRQKQDLLLTFKNATDEDFTELMVNIREEVYAFPNVQKGQTTKPIEVRDSYRYCYAQAITAKDTVSFGPQDFVGETLVTQGKLLITFEIIPNPNGKRSLESNSTVE